jgi:hypothetical protein
MLEAKDFLEMFDGLRTRARALRLGRSRSQPLRYRSSIYIRAVKLRAFAVTTAERSVPELPTVAEIATGFEASSWFGLGTPNTTQPEIVDRPNREMNSDMAGARRYPFGHVATDAPETHYELSRFLVRFAASGAQSLKSWLQD